MIKIMKGTVGIITEDGRRSTRTEKDGAFSLPRQEEERLVSLGVAAYYTDGVIGPKAGRAAIPSGHLHEAGEIYPNNPVGHGTGYRPEDGEFDGADEDDGDEGQGDGADAYGDDLDSMGFNDIRALAKSMGVPASGSRDEIIGRIKEASSVTMSVAQPQ